MPWNIISKRHTVHFPLNSLQTGRLKRGLKLTDHKNLDWIKTSPWKKKLLKSPCQLPLTKIKGKKKNCLPPYFHDSFSYHDCKADLVSHPKGATEGYNFIWVSFWWNFFPFLCLLMSFSILSFQVKEEGLPFKNRSSRDWEGEGVLNVQSVFLIPLIYPPERRGRMTEAEKILSRKNEYFRVCRPSVENALK